MTLEDIDFNGLMFFLTIFGKDLPEVLKNPKPLKEEMNRHPKGKLLLEKVATLSVVEMKHKDIVVDRDVLAELMKKLVEALKKLLINLLCRVD